jgi:multidrug efflux pump
MAKFFIDRPVFAVVVSLFLVLAGSLSLLGLPVAQFPDIALPTVKVTTLYPGAGADVVEEAVTAPLDSQINGVTDMKYIRAVSGDDGSASISVTFELGRDPDIAAVETQNRVSQVVPRLPGEVNAIGVTVNKASSDTLMYVTLYSPDDSYDRLFIDNYVYNFIVDSIKRVPGVGDVKVFGAEFGMRIWLQPDRMASYRLTTTDVMRAIQEQNKQAVAGQVGQPPADSESGFQYSLRLQGRLVEEEEFGAIVLRTRPDGSFLRLRDVARIELGAAGYATTARYNGREASAFGVSLAPGANALNTAELIREQLDTLKAAFPAGLDYAVAYDTSEFVDASIEEVVHTFFEALALVLIVVFLFLQSWRAVLIPMLAVPVSLIATLISYQALGFSINTLSMFGMVLAIGIVVDDAIVVVEAVEHKIAHLGMRARDATYEAMSEVSGPVVATALVLAAVFVPMAFVPGVTGQLYQQFALTIAVSTLFSALVALTLTPALSALLLRPRAAEPRGPVARFFAAFNRGFDAMTVRYTQVVGVGVRGLKRLVFLLVVLFAGLYILFRVTPTGFVPDEDQGAFFMQVVLPEAAALSRTETVIEDLGAEVRELPGVESVMSIVGFDLLSGTAAPNGGLVVARLDPWAERSAPEEQIDALLQRAGAIGMRRPEALAFPFNPPALPGFGAVSGFSMMLQARGSQSAEELADMARSFVAAANARPEIGRASTTYAAATPGYRLRVDRERVKKLGIPISDVFGTLQAYLGGVQVNDFSRFGKNYRVTLQADAAYRRDISALSKLFVRNGNGEMVPLDTIVTAIPDTGPRFTMRYNLYRSAEITGTPASGYSSGQALQALRDVAAEVLPADYGYEWSGQSLEEVETGNIAALVLALSVVVVFLFLAALYESWSVPFAVLLAAPLGILGAMIGTLVGGMNFDVYGQIGLVTLVGLAAKNAILIVEFAKQNYEKGTALAEAALEAARLRLRPILMTSFAFILGVTPLVLASGAGAASKQSVGIAVFSGMLSATILGSLLVPAFYVLVQTLAERLSGRREDAATAGAARGEAPEG